ncbi:bifunctional diguanylate cyclase/phosphodiesterase [Oribacterium sp. WCC10]|uniref:bifunctional diguanylate cyclase/phosphodiesterase n=1 Tax=Oribacterium sp. WCC10 TaxID=1855343 RepID=UPI0008ECDD59|nr:bifunctional diguanylate cyclase/phosphodiesterase [Oribacterium sp. WCC10]SFG20213.1 diguanylate cyclase (GGDEF) domain-containing protein [Oribacterium sp. WCC10]
MKKRDHFLNIIRYFFVAMGISCFIASLFVFSYHFQKENHSPIERPKMVDHKVLFLSSYDPLYFTYRDQIRGLEEVLFSNGIEFDATFMDAKYYHTEEDIRDFYEFFKKRYFKKINNYEAVLVGDDDALTFVLDHQEEFFKGLPIVFFGINNLELANHAQKQPDITGFYEVDYFHKTLMSAMKALPDRKILVSIHDETTTGMEDMQHFYSFADKYTDYTFRDINTSTCSKEELINQLKALSSNTILFYMNCYDDRNDVRHSMHETTCMIVNNTDVPVFRNYSGGRDYGVLGGTYMDFTAQTRSAAEIIVEVLNNGSDISSYKLSFDTPPITEYSYPILKKYGIKENLLPEDTRYVNKPVSVFELYRRMLPLAVLMTVALISCIAALAATLIKEKAQIKALIASKAEILDSQKKIIYQAKYDDLLGLYNRRTIVDYLNDNLSLDDKYSVVMVDIDGFKDINENYGHDTGDKILQKISEEIKQYAYKAHMSIGRYGGDEFLLLLKGHWLDEKDMIVKGLASLFDKPFCTETVNVVMSASIGISNSDGVTAPDQHVINAEIAMYEAKVRGKNMVFIYADDMKNKLTEESKIKAAFLEAFETDGFYIKYQPKVNAKTKELAGYEALVRLKYSDYGPGAFIPVVEKSGWTTRLGRLITRLVIAQQASWRNSGKKIYPVSINFSSRQINDTGYCDYLQSLLNHYDIPSEYIQIEITESLLVEESPRTEELFKRFAIMGIKLLLDDFGTGYSSLAYLTYVPVDDVKLDKSLVDTFLIEGKEDFIKDVILLVHDMGKIISIEGVEHEWQYNKLVELNADIIQGYYFSKPLDPDEAIDFKVL